MNNPEQDTTQDVEGADTSAVPETPSATPAGGTTDDTSAGADSVTVRNATNDRPDPRHQHPSPEVVQSRINLGPTLTLLLGIAAAVIAIAGLRQIGSIIGPTFLAITLVLAVHPLYRRLARFLPKWAAAVVLLFLLYGILALFVGSLAFAIARLSETLPDYSSKFTNLIDDGARQLAEWGFGRDQIENQLRTFDYKNLTGIVQALANTLSNTTSQLLFLLTVMVFLTMDTVGFSDRLTRVHHDKPDVADALVDFGNRVRTYWVVSTVFGLIVAVLDVVALMIIGVPLAVTFGLLAFVTNYIPNVGFVLGLIPPALMALLDSGPLDALIVIIVFSVLNFVIQSILQPKFTGDAVGINPTTAFLSLVFWSFVFGPLGALLAIPLTLLVKSLLLDRDPQSRWINEFISAGDKRAALVRETGT